MGVGEVSLALVVALAPSEVLPLPYPLLHLEDGVRYAPEDLLTQVAQRAPPTHSHHQHESLHPAGIHCHAWQEENRQSSLGQGFTQEQKGMSYQMSVGSSTEDDGVVLSWSESKEKIVEVSSSRQASRAGRESEPL